MYSEPRPPRPPADADFAPRRLRLDQLVTDLVDSLRLTLPDSVALVFQPGAPEVWCHADPGQLGAALGQLVAHAMDNQPTGGLIRLTTAPHRQSDRGGWVGIEVTDSGAALDDPHPGNEPAPSGSEDRAIVAHLSLAADVARRHGGRLAVPRRPDGVTVLRLLMPAIAPPTASDQAPPGSQPRRILLVDDDPEIRRFAGKILRHGGYEVSICEDGVEALALIAGEGTFDAVVLDWALPGLDGRRVREQLQARRQRPPLLVISGYPREQYQALGGVDAATPWLMKPFKPAALLHAVQSLLDQADAARGS